MSHQSVVSQSFLVASLVVFLVGFLLAWGMNTGAIVVIDEERKRLPSFFTNLFLGLALLALSFLFA